MRRPSIHQVIGAATVASGLLVSACSSTSATASTDTSASPSSSAVTTTSRAAASATTASGPKDIVATAVAVGQFTTLAKALQAAGLVETLQGAGPYAVFAPTDDAFAKLPAGTLDTLLLPENKDKLKTILSYHVIKGNVPASEVVKLNGKTVDTVAGQPLTVKVDGANVSLVDATGATVAVVKTDVTASNGIIHVVDAVLMPRPDHHRHGRSGAGPVVTPVDRGGTGRCPWVAGDAGARKRSTPSRWRLPGGDGLDTSSIRPRTVLRRLSPAFYFDTTCRTMAVRVRSWRGGVERASAAGVCGSGAGGGSSEAAGRMESSG